MSVNRQLLGLTGALIASVSLAVLASTANTSGRVTAKQAALKGVTATSSAAPEQWVSRLIVKLRNPSASELARPMSASRVKALARTAGVGMKSVRAIAGDASLLALDSALPLSEAKAVAARLARDSAVEYAEPDIMLKKLVTPNDTRFFDWQWNLFAPTSIYTGAVTGGGTPIPAPATGGANLPLAWDATTGHSSVVLAVIDTGIVNHQDLNGAGISPFSATYVPNGRFLPGYDFISSDVGASEVPANFVANDGDGRDADPSDPGDWVTAAEEGMYPTTCADSQADSSWHGTHVAGIAAAMAGNASGIAGIGWNIRILPVRALGKCGGSLSDIAEAIRWAAGLSVPGVPTNTTPARVINLSLGGGTTCSGSMQSAVNAAIAAGSVVVVATGNEGAIGLSAPANCDGVIAVTAHTITGESADYANVGAAGGVGPQPTISAAGGGSPTGGGLGSGGPTDNPNWMGFYIWSTILFGNTTPTSLGGAGGASTGPAYSGFTGTSAATPQVAAVAALIKSMIPGATPAQIRTFIVSNVRPHPAGGLCVTGGGLAGQCGAGLLDANLAVRAAALIAPPVIMGQPQNASAFEGQTATFFVDATGAPLSYQWRRDGVAIAGAVFASYTTPALTIATDNGATYSAVITNGANGGSTATSTAATLTVAVAPPPPPAGAPPPTGGGGGGALPFWQLLLLSALSLAARVRITNRTT
jgi:serine protease